jgi:hypothetical protein
LNRIFGAIAVFGGWLCICFGAFLGLAGSEFLGLNHTEGPLAPAAVYGISAAVVLWLFVFAALLSVLPLGTAIFEPDPRRRTAITAVVMAAVGVALLPDELGRSFGLPLLPGALLVFYGGRLIYRETIQLAAEDKDEVRAGLVTTVSDTAGQTAAAGETVAAGKLGTADVAAPTTAAETVAAGESAAAGSQPAEAGTEDPSPAASDSDRECPWCSAPVPADASVCPSCNAAMDEDPVAAAMHLPGLTEVSPELRAYAEQVRSGKPKRGLLSIMMSSPSTPVASTPPPTTEPEALRPPSSEVRAEMARINAEIAAGIAASGTASAEGTRAEATPAADDATPSTPAADDATPSTPAADDTASAPVDAAPAEIAPPGGAPVPRRRRPRP